MESGPTVAGATTARRGWLKRWWLLLANLLVANAVSLHVGPGGLRTPSSAVNLWFAAIVLMAPLLRWSVRRFHRPGMLVVAKCLIMGACMLGTAVAACLVGTLIGILVLLAVGALMRIPGYPPFWLWCLAIVISLLLVEALVPALRGTRLASVFSAVRALACLPPYGMLAVVLLFVPIDAPAWVGGRDYMFEPVACIGDGKRSYMAVRSDPMAFTKPTLRIMATTPLVPSVLGWWRELGSLYGVGSCDLRLEGDELCVGYHYSSDPESRQPLQRRFRIR